MEIKTFHAVFVCAVINISSHYSEAISVEKDLAMTLEQKTILDKFKKRVTPLLTKSYMKSDLYLVRWLRAKNFDLNAAENMLRQSLKWREANRMDTILEEDWSDIRRNYPAVVDTFDKEGRPIGTIDINEWDLRRAIIQGIAPKVLRYMFYQLENQTVQVFEQQAKGLNVTQWKGLSNGDGFNVVQHACPICIQYWIRYVQGLENNYNGWMDEFIIIDAPPTINIVLEAVRPFLSRQTRDTFRVLGQNRAKWMAFLDERISRDQRRASYGGTKPPVSF